MAIDEEEIDDIYAQCISGYSDNLPQTNYVSPVYKILFGVSKVQKQVCLLKKKTNKNKLPVVLAR